MWRGVVGVFAEKPVGFTEKDPALKQSTPASSDGSPPRKAQEEGSKRRLRRGSTQVERRRDAVLLQQWYTRYTQARGQRPQSDWPVLSPGWAEETLAEVKRDQTKNLHDLEVQRIRLHGIRQDHIATQIQVAHGSDPVGLAVLRMTEQVVIPRIQNEIKRMEEAAEHMFRGSTHLYQKWQTFHRTVFAPSSRIPGHKFYIQGRKPSRYHRKYKLNHRHDEKQ